MEISAQILATGKLFGIFAVLVVLLRLHTPLWLTIFAGALTTALMCGVSPSVWPEVFLSILRQPDFLILCCMIFLILMLSGVQDASGQSHDLVEGLEEYIQSPRIRLVLFPALIGLLPMPGGALFSCPMIRDAARNMNLGGERKALINYWFRHIWELAWPLYPGYALACTLLDIPVTRLLLFTFPAVFIAFGSGWFFFLRDLRRNLVETTCEEQKNAPTAHRPLAAILMNGLPIAVTLAGAVVFGAFFSRVWPSLPTQAVFCFSLALAVAIALVQGRNKMKRPLAAIAFNKNTGRIMLLLLAIFVFKDTIILSGIVDDFSRIGQSPLMVCLTFVLIPFISGILTGILVGLVGLSFPIIIGILAHSTLQEYATPLMVLALTAGNCGQMLSPLHVCLVVTSEFFTTRLPALLRSLFMPTLVIFSGGMLWALALFFMGAKF